MAASPFLRTQGRIYAAAAFAGAVMLIESFCLTGISIDIGKPIQCRLCQEKLISVHARKADIH